jgi:chorismate dehydratase
MVPSYQRKLKLGKIGFLNVQPIYYPLEAGLVPHGFTLVSGTPAELNGLMLQGTLDISVVSSIEYARHPDRYIILPDLSISCRGAVESVLLLSRVPFEDLAEQTILVSKHSHTSVALLHLILSERFGFQPLFHHANCTETLAAGQIPAAMLVIGDEALVLRRLDGYPHRLDLGEAWFSWTGLPFVFALWVIQRKAFESMNGALDDALASLSMAKLWGLMHLNRVCLAALTERILTLDELHDYYQRLSYDLGTEEKAGLKLFFDHLGTLGELRDVPPLRVYPGLACAA